MLTFNFLNKQIIDLQSDEKKSFNWKDADDKFVRVNTLALEEIMQQEKRLLACGFHFPHELRAFWSEIGYGYLCSAEAVDNAFVNPTIAMDVYLSEGAWTDVKLCCNLYVPNELPFFEIGHLDYITIGLEPDVNLGKIYFLGEEIASSLTEFIQHIIENPTFYNTYNG